MAAWDWECFRDFINEDFFKITDAGPLHNPILGFSIRRDEKLQLILETRITADAKSSAPQGPSPVRLNTDSIEFTSITGLKAVAKGVQGFSVRSHDNYAAALYERCETASVHRIDCHTSNEAAPAYTIDWVENLHTNAAIWPTIIVNNLGSTHERRLGQGADELVLKSSDNKGAMSRTCAIITVEGVKIYICSSWATKDDGRIEPGCIIYDGSPDEVFRRRIRECVSFALGHWLVFLGSSTFCKDWNLRSFYAVSAYSIYGRVFDLIRTFPAPMGKRFDREVETVAFSRMINGIYAKYDLLDFGVLSWAYWHACSATMHIAAVHFGASIECLQRSYERHRPSGIITKFISDRNDWRAFYESVSNLISGLEVPDKVKAAMKERIGELNRLPQREVLKLLFESLGMDLGTEEDKAWMRRNDAAHGNQASQGKEIEIIMEVKLLKLILHRLVLRIADAADVYHDDYTLGGRTRPLEAPVD